MGCKAEWTGWRWCSVSSTTRREADEGNRAIQYDVLAAVTATTTEARKTALDDLAEQRDTLREAVNENQTLLEGAGAGEQLHRAFVDLGPTLDAFEATSDAVVAALDRGAGRPGKGLAAADAAHVEFDTRFDQLTARIDEFADTARRQAERDAARARQRMLVLLVVACIVVPAVGLVIRRAINHTTSQIRAVVDDIFAPALVGTSAGSVEAPCCTAPASPNSSRAIPESRRNVSKSICTRTTVPSASTKTTPCSCTRPPERSSERSMSRFLRTPFQMSNPSKCGSSTPADSVLSEYQM